MTIAHTTPAQTAPGDPHLYDLAASLATTTGTLADAIDDDRPGWLGLAAVVSDMLDTLVTTKLDAEATGNPAPPFPCAEPDIIVSPPTLYEVAADLSATAGDLAADLADNRFSPASLNRARSLLAVLALALGGDA